MQINKGQPCEMSEPDSLRYGVTAQETRPLIGGWSPGDPMTAAELVLAREFLGLTGAWIAQTAHASARSVRRWESGHAQIPAAVHAVVEGLESLTAAAVTWLRSELTHYLVATPGVLLLRTDEDYRAVCPEGIAMPARWHRHVAARAGADVPALMIAFQGERAPAGSWLRPVVAVADLGVGLDEARYSMTVLDSPTGASVDQA